MDESNYKVRPLWDVIPQLFLVPILGPGLIVLFVLSLAAVYFTSFLMLVIILFVAIKYGMEVMQHTAQGQIEPLTFSASLLNDNYELPFKQILIFAALYLLYSRVEGAIAYVIVINIIIFYLFFLPASIMTLGYTQSLIKAINPFDLIDLMKRLGWTYLVLYLFLLMLNGGASAAFYYLVGDATYSIALFFDLIFQVYFAWVMYAMMGYALYQHHEDIGYKIGGEDAVSGYDLDQFHNLVSNKQYPEAEKELRKRIYDDHENIDLVLKLQNFLKITGDDKKLMINAQGLIAQLLNNKQVVQALSVYMDCSQRVDSFKPEKETHFLPLIKEMRVRKNYDEASQLSNGFHQRYPSSEETPELYLLMAQIFIEDLAQYDKGEAILAFLIKGYPNHALVSEFQRYRMLLTQLKLQN